MIDARYIALQHLEMGLHCGVLPATLIRIASNGSFLAIIPCLKMFRQYFSGTFSRLKERNSVAVQLQEYRKDKEVAQRRERLAQQEKERAENAERAATQRAEEARAAAAEARRLSQYVQPPSYAAHDLPMYPSSYHAPPMWYGGRSSTGARSSRGGGTRFYNGGQFIPGGGRAPPGGIWM